MRACGCHVERRESGGAGAEGVGRCAEQSPGKGGRTPHGGRRELPGGRRPGEHVDQPLPPAWPEPFLELEGGTAAGQTRGRAPEGGGGSGGAGGTSCDSETVCARPPSPAARCRPRGLAPVVPRSASGRRSGEDPRESVPAWDSGEATHPLPGRPLVAPCDDLRGSKEPRTREALGPRWDGLRGRAPGQTGLAPSIGQGKEERQESFVFYFGTFCNLFFS